ncbi:MAG: hypothetical protein KatS3mg009_3256 [Acidimicrobiia bacterium]|nr:MAG: hypothetical protein KatS3mg009_3256 [Acidimicrobiia bacterium]
MLVRLRRAAGAAARDARLAWRDVELGTLGPRIAGAVFVVAGLLAAVVGALGTAGSRGAVGPVAGGAVVAGLGFLLAPWHHWPRPAQLAIPVAAFVLLAVAGVHDEGLATPFLAVLPLPFVYVGFTQRPGWSLALAPPAAAALAVGSRFEPTATVVTTVLFALPMSVFVGEAIAQAQRRRARAELHVERLLRAVRVLAHVEDEQRGAQLVASLAADLLDADAVAVLLADRPGSSRFRQRAWFGHPALADTAPLVVDGSAVPALGAAGPTWFLPDASAAPPLAAPGSPGRVRSAALVPLPGGSGEPLGVVLALWGSRRRVLPAPARQAGELLSQEAGRMFERLRATAVLARDAQTDPLTELANRRTFARALATLRPGDAVVLVDLDHFKRVNDRFGHAAGDRTLRDLARCLRRAARQVDTVARYGGEEFALVLPEAGAEGARAALRRVRGDWAQARPATTFSAGIAVHEAGADPADTLRRADEALYRAKAAGRNRDEVATVSEILLP